jgi:hypothetical protein
MVETKLNGMIDDDGDFIFAFHDLDYIPFGFSSDTAPYIETPMATMRAAATLMGLDLATDAILEDLQKKKEQKIVVCDLGCGAGELRTEKLLLNCRSCDLSPSTNRFCKTVPSNTSVTSVLGS